VLKWTYAYGYYCASKAQKQKKEQFEFWQTDLEKYCETLHKMVETPLDVFLDPNIVDRSPFYKFKSQLVCFFEATKKYYVALIAGIEQDTDQVNIV